MTTFEVRAMTLPTSVADVTHNFATYAIALLNVVPQAGVTLTEMDKRLALLAKLKDAVVGSTIEIENGEIKMLGDLLKRMTFPMVSDEISGFGKYIAELVEAAK